MSNLFCGNCDRERQVWCMESLFIHYCIAFAASHTRYIAMFALPPAPESKPKAKLCLMYAKTGRYPEETQWPCDCIPDGCNGCRYFGTPESLDCDHDWVEVADTCEVCVDCDAERLINPETGMVAE